MKQHKILELPPDEAKEHQLLQRRIEWLELKNSAGYRASGSRCDELNQIYGDISDATCFLAQLASIQR